MAERRARIDSVGNDRIALTDEAPPVDAPTAFTWKGILKLSLENPTKWTTVKEVSLGAYRNFRTTAGHYTEAENNGFDVRWEETGVDKGGVMRGVVWVKPL